MAEPANHSPRLIKKTAFSTQSREAFARHDFPLPRGPLTPRRMTIATTAIGSMAGTAVTMVTGFMAVTAATATAMVTVITAVTAAMPVVVVVVTSLSTAAAVAVGDGRTFHRHYRPASDGGLIGIRMSCANGTLDLGIQSRMPFGIVAPHVYTFVIV